jgi:hypothetical protein
MGKFRDRRQPVLFFWCNYEKIEDNRFGFGGFPPKLSAAGLIIPFGKVRRLHKRPAQILVAAFAVVSPLALLITRSPRGAASPAAPDLAGLREAARLGI